MLYLLAQRAGGAFIVNPDLLLELMPARVWDEWVEVLRLEREDERAVFEVERTLGDQRAGIIAATLANLHAHKKGAKVHRPEDFFPNLKEAERARKRKTPLDGNAVFAWMQYLTRMLGGTIIDKRKPKGE